MASVQFFLSQKSLQPRVTLMLNNKKRSVVKNLFKKNHNFKANIIIIKII